MGAKRFTWHSPNRIYWDIGKKSCWCSTSIQNSVRKTETGVISGAVCRSCNQEECPGIRSENLFFLCQLTNMLFQWIANGEDGIPGNPVPNLVEKGPRSELGWSTNIPCMVELNVTVQQSKVEVATKRNVQV